MDTTRAGIFVTQLEGYKAFLPKSLPPDPPLRMDWEMINLLSQADRALARLDGTAITLPNPDLFVAMYVRKEALLSSQIEGTQSSLVDLLDYEAGVPNQKAGDAGAVRHCSPYQNSSNAFSSLLFFWSSCAFLLSYTTPNLIS